MVIFNTENLITGIDIIDEQHQALFKLINNLDGIRDSRRIFIMLFWNCRFMCLIILKPKKNTCVICHTLIFLLTRSVTINLSKITNCC